MPARECIVFIHAVGGDSSFWAPQVAEFSKRYHVVAVDLGGPAETVSMARFADDVARAIDEAGFGKAHLVGLSMGGVVAVETLRRHPDRVRSLTLCNSWGYLADGAGRLAWAEGMLATRTVAEFSALTLPDLFAPNTARETIAHGVEVEGRKDKAIYLACWRSMLLHDQRDVLARLDVPLLLVGGEHDKITPTEPCLTDVLALVSTARLVQLRGAGHFSNLDQPAAFNDALRAFLRGASAHGSDLRQSPPESATIPLPEASTAEQLLRLLEARGIELFASNSGTDFTPIIEALAALDEQRGGPSPLRVVAAPHENTAIAMAHGHTLVSGRPQVVMAHVNVGTANMGLGLINARRARVPMLLLAGRTPWYEEGKDGVRTNFVQWGQDTFDQGGYFREFTKWDYELKGPHALEIVVDRALAVSASAPEGPVYLTLPKEPLCEVAPARKVAAEPRQQPSSTTRPDRAALERAAALIRTAKRPLIITADLGRRPGGPEALVRFSEACGAGVVEHGKRNFMNFPTEHAHHLGFEPNELVKTADLVVALEAPVPWIPAFARLERAPHVIGIGVDPLFSDLPMRGFPVDLALAGDPAETLRALTALLPKPSISSALRAEHDRLFSAARDAARADGARDAITKRFLSRCIGDAIDNDVIIFNEYDLDPWQVPRQVPGGWFENSVASGLGWSLGAALGGAIAAPERTIIATLGDGSYLFNTPLSAHHVAVSEGLPVCFIVFDDSAWSTIKRSTRGSHPNGVAARTGRFALCDFSVKPRYDDIARAFGAVGLRAERPAEVAGVLAEALRLVREARQHVLVQVVCERDG